MSPRNIFLNRKIVLVTGLHRTGTTYIGRQIASKGRASYLWEPTSPNCAINNKHLYFNGLPKQWYIDPSSNNILILQDFLKLCRSSNRLLLRNNISKVLLSSVPRSDKKLFLSSYFEEISRALLFKKHILIKDPFLLFCADKLSPNIDYIIATIKNPFSWVNSLLRQNWIFDWGSFYDQKFWTISQSCLLQESLEKSVFYVHKSPNMRNVVNASLLWLMMYEYIRSYKNSFSHIICSENIQKFDHESFCRQKLSVPSVSSLSFNASLIFGSIAGYKHSSRISSWKSIFDNDTVSTIQDITQFNENEYFSLEAIT